jgi:hypothetical protein
LAISGDPDVEAVFGESWGIVQGLGWGLTALSVLGAWFLVWRLMKVESWQTVRIVIAGIWILGLGISALDILLAAWFSGFRIIDVAAATAQDLIRSLIFAVVWTAYFLRSERVANTYLREPDEEDLQQVFG